MSRLVMEQLSRSIKESARGHHLLLEISSASPLFFEDHPELVAPVKDAGKGQTLKKKKEQSKRAHEMPMFKDNETNGHPQSKETKNVVQTETELKKTEKKGRKSKMENNEMQLNVQDEIDVSDPQKQTQRKNKVKNLQTQSQRYYEENALENESSCKKKKKAKRKHEDRSEQLAIDVTDITVPDETRKPKKRHKSMAEHEMNSVRSKSAAGLSDITVPNEKRKNKKKKKHARHTEIEGGMEIQTVSITDNPGNVDLNTKKYNEVDSVLTDVHANVNKKKKRKKKCLTERQLSKSATKEQTADGGSTAETIGDAGTDGGSTAETIGDAGTDRGSTAETIGDAGTDGGSTAETIGDAGTDGGSTAETIGDAGTDGGSTAETIGDAGTDGAEVHGNGVRPIAVEPGTQRDKSKKKKARCSINLQALNELKEFIPDVESRSSSEVERMLMYDLPRFKEFKKEGIKVRSGKFTAQENETLMNNVYDFMALTGVKNACSLFHPKRYSEPLHIRKLKTLYKFQERIAQGIPRLIKQVYIRGRKLFDETNYRGRFTEEELCSLIKLHELHGSCWAKISKLTGRSETALEKRFSQLIKRSGKWSKKEEKRLIHAVRDILMGQAEQSIVATFSIDKLWNNIPWRTVSERVKMRNWIQCRLKWMSILRKKLNSGQSEIKKPDSRRIKVDLIKALNAMQVEDVSWLNWEDLAITVGKVTPYYLQKLYYRLKVSNIPLWQSKTFCEIVDIFYTQVLPKLEQQLLEGSLESKSQTEAKRLYLLSEIFDESEDFEVENM